MSRDSAAVVAGVLAPLAVTTAPVPLRSSVANTSVALLLVLTQLPDNGEGPLPRGEPRRGGVAPSSDRGRRE